MNLSLYGLKGGKYEEDDEQFVFFDIEIAFQLFCVAHQLPHQYYQFLRREKNGTRNQDVSRKNLAKQQTPKYRFQQPEEFTFQNDFSKMVVDSPHAAHHPGFFIDTCTGRDWKRPSRGNECKHCRILLE